MEIWYRTKLLTNKLFQTEGDIFTKTSLVVKIIKLAIHNINSFCEADELELVIFDKVELNVRGNHMTSREEGCKPSYLIDPKDCILSALEFYEVEEPEKYIEIYETKEDQ